MLFFTRWKAAAILLTALVVCLCAVPNFFSEDVIRHWPSWAQRHIVLGLDLQGGSHLLLEVDSAAVRKEQLQAINDDVLRVLRQARIPVTGRAIRGNGSGCGMACQPAHGRDNGDIWPWRHQSDYRNSLFLFHFSGLAP